MTEEPPTEQELKKNTQPSTKISIPNSLICCSLSVLALLGVESAKDDNRTCQVRSSPIKKEDVRLEELNAETVAI